MSIKACVGRALVALVPLLMIGSAAEAQFNRVFVAAKTGNDASSCNDVTTPCKTFAGAFTQVNAGGEIIALESGGYGPLTINKAVNINAPAGIVAFIHPPTGDAVTISAGAADTVILRGLTLNGGAGNGITVNTVGELFVEHCTITSYAINGIGFSAPGGALFMRDDDVRKCSAAVLLTSSGTAARAVIRDSTFAGNFDGVAAGPGSFVVVTDSVAAGNGDAGFRSTTTTAGNAEMSLERVQAVSNVTGLYAFASGGGTATLRFANSLVTQNTASGVSDGGGTGTVLGSSPGTSVIAGNAPDVSGTLGPAVTLK